MRHFTFISFFVLLLSLAGGGVASAAPADGYVEWTVGSGLYVAGQDFTVSRKVAGSLTATGEVVSLGSGADIRDDVWIAGRNVASEGRIGGNLDIRAQNALINGVVKGDVSFYGVHLSFGPDARVDGDVRYFAALPAEIASGAVIKGDMKMSVLRDAPAPEVRPAPMPTPDQGPDEFYGGRGWSGQGWDVERWGSDGWSAPGYNLSWSGAVGFGLVAGLISLCWPLSGARLVGGLSEQSFAALAMGFVWLVATPVLALVAAFTIIGLPLAFILLLLWPLSVLAGIIAIILALGAFIDARFTMAGEGLARRLAGIILATFLLRVGIAVPGFGGLIWLAAVCLGIGALFLASRSRLSI
mgnify:CR=1 FL=1|tara:strand:+ start:25298 stop:26365 length:1068 start_codon:yes stop_codon:yes gene_type:complete